MKQFQEPGAPGLTNVQVSLSLHQVTTEQKEMLNGPCS